MKKTAKVLCALVSAALLLAGCGSGAKTETKASAEAESTTAAESPAAEGQDSIASKAGAESTAEESSEALTAAPDFTVQEADGTVHKLSEYKGKPIVLNFWASWCGPCRSEMPEFNEVYKERGTEVQFLMVNLTDGNRETVKSASDFVAAQGYSLPILYDTAQDAARTYGVFSIPCTYFIDANGMMTAQARGAIDKDTLLHGIEMITTK